MASGLDVGEISVALRERLFPSITTWNRLEARPRSQSFDRALKAEIRDPLWMLTKQWQMGEFEGCDAGSPVFAKLLLQTTRLTKYRPAGGAAQLFDAATPLETKVERRPVPMHRQQRILTLDLCLVMARQWFALIAGIADYRAAYMTAYPIAVPDPTQSRQRRRVFPPGSLGYLSSAGGPRDGRREIPRVSPRRPDASCLRRCCRNRGRRSGRSR